jgi:UDP-N-acetylmuramoyl-L-alanine---L-glutamate ligase
MSDLARIIPTGTPVIALWGYGREGRATHSFLSKNYPNARIVIIVDKPVRLDTGGAPLLSGDAGLAAITKGFCNLVIKSPGISLYRREIAEAKAKGIRFTSATNLWFEAYTSAFTIGVTGTKGKSTTASLLHYLFGLAGKRSKLLGNVGVPMLAEAPGEDVTVLELSSYQIADLEFSPSIALITNLHPEHGPWHHGHDNYFRDKMRLVTRNTSELAIVNEKDDRVAQFVAQRGNVQYFEVPEAFHVGGTDNAPALFYGQDEVCIRNFPLRGRHNWVNLAGAFAALSMAAAYDHYTLHRGHIWDFSGFTPLPHRLQELQLANSVLAVNDSISTIPETTRAALDVHAHRPFHLILGGVDRGQDFSALLAHLKTLPTLRGIYLPDGRHPEFPSTGEQLERDLLAAGLPLAGRFASFDEATTAALNAAVSGDTILLSPGAPSQTEFTDFEKRGMRFLQLCERQRQNSSVTGNPSLSLT